MKRMFLTYISYLQKKGMEQNVLDIDKTIKGFEMRTTAWLFLEGLKEFLIVLYLKYCNFTVLPIDNPPYRYTNFFHS